MRKHTIRIAFWIYVISMLTCSLGYSGQVITEDVRAWARKVIAQEKAILELTEQNSRNIEQFEMAISENDTRNWRHHIIDDL